MKIQKLIGIMIMCVALAGTAMAQSGPQGQAPAAAPQVQSSGPALDMSPAFDAMDKNKDGKVNKEEWLASGMTQDSYDKLFTMLDGNKDGAITRDEFGVPRFEVDTNKDGKASLEEFVTANKKAAAGLGSGGQGGAPAGVPGGAPNGPAPSAPKN